MVEFLFRLSFDYFPLPESPFIPELREFLLASGRFLIDEDGLEESEKFIPSSSFSENSLGFSFSGLSI
jgi:hypothetical protein